MVRFWNLTASQPALAAAPISFFARPTSPLWLIPISAMKKTGRPGPTSRPPMETLDAVTGCILPTASGSQGRSRCREERLDQPEVERRVDVDRVRGVHHERPDVAAVEAALGQTVDAQSQHRRAVARVQRRKVPVE